MFETALGAALFLFFMSMGWLLMPLGYRMATADWYSRHWWLTL